MAKCNASFEDDDIKKSAADIRNPPGYEKHGTHQSLTRDQLYRGVVPGSSLLGYGVVTSSEAECRGLSEQNRRPTPDSARFSP